MRKTLIAVAFLACVAGLKADGKYEPTEIQKLHLQLLQKDALIAKIGLEQAQTNFQVKLQALSDEAVKIKAANKWGDEVVFDPNDLSFKLKETKAEVKK